MAALKNTNDALPQLAAGCVVELIGLQAKPELNGRVAKVLSFSKESGRYAVELLPPRAGRVHPSTVYVTYWANTAGGLQGLVERYIVTVTYFERD